MNFRRKENAVGRGCWSVDGALLRVWVGRSWRTCLLFLQALTSWERAFFDLCFWVVAPLGCSCKKVLLPKVCVSLENNC